MKPSDPLLQALQSIPAPTLAAALDAASCAIVIADARKSDFPLIYVSRAFETITGYTARESIGRNCRFLQGRDRNQPELKIIHKAIQSRRACQVVLANYRKDGTRFWNELRLAPVFDEARRLTHYVGIQTDVTFQREAETALKEHQKDLERLVRERTDELDRKNAALTEVLGRLELEKRSLERRLTANVDRLILPLMKKIGRGSGPEGRPALAALEASLQELTSPFGEGLSRPLYRLSAREIEICGFIRRGLGTKEIAQLLKSSEATVENQRNSIRKKLGISRKSVNLSVFLRGFADPGASQNTYL